MATKFMLQGATEDSHLDQVQGAIALPGLQRLVISVAFLTQRGFDLAGGLVAPVAKRTTVLAGIRNGVTSAQGLLASVNCGCKTYAVDTGSRHVLFHPKVYLARSENEAKVIVGSANLTIGGLYRNIEASVSLHLDLQVGDDQDLVADLEDKIDAMIMNYPKHVLEVADEESVSDLLSAARLVDERVQRPPVPGRNSKSRDLDAVPCLGLDRRRIEMKFVGFPAEAFSACWRAS